MTGLGKKTVEDIDVKGKTCLVRCDFNVPVKDGVITDDKRIREALKTIKYLKAQGAKQILCSHMGRPKGEVNMKYSLQPVQKRLRELLDCARQNGNRVMVCHVLRYAHFYQTIKKRLLAGEIGKIITIVSNEYVSYDHMVTSYVRGKWAKFENCHSSMLLAKCSHDIDILTWLLGTDHPRSVCSFGSRSLFRAENAPKEAGSRCTLDCPLVDRCPYSAKRIYLDRPGAWDGYVWKDFGCKRPDSMAVMLESLSTDNPYGRCVFRCDNDVVDRQSVLIEFQSGAIGSHNMIGGAAGGGRTIHITGTAGEIYGSFEQQKLHIKHIHPTPDSLFDEEVLDFSDEDLSGHGGGDARLMEDLIRFVRGEETSVSCTGLADSMPGHMTVFMADKSRLAGGAPQKIALGDAINTY